MSEEVRGRGRARARAKPPGQGVQGPPRGPSGPPPAAAAGPKPGPAGPPPGMGAPPPRPASQVSGGRATHRGTGRPIDEAQLTSKMGGLSVGGSGDTSGSSGNGNGNGGAPVGRGTFRGKRQISMAITTTRPQTLTSKKGTTGTVVQLQANYFPILSRREWKLIQYRIDFAPNIDLTGERKRLMRTAMTSKFGVQGAYLFDGTVLYWPQQKELTDSAEFGSEIELFVQRESDETQVRITIRKVSIVAPTDAQYIQVFNILTRSALKLLELQLINRNYFDPKAKIEIKEFFLELWPGYSTTIRQHEHNILMNANIENKVMRTDTCLHLLTDIARRNPRGYKEEFAHAVIGSVVLTDYNNRTYSITDVNWADSPRSTFDRSGTKVSYQQYYKERYNIDIKESQQPLLVSKNKPRDRRAREQQAVEQVGTADNTLVYLIPELCRMTGLTDEMRANFKLMQAMATHTRIGPAERINRLLKMNQRLHEVEKVRQKFKEWELDIDRKLVDLTGRVLQCEQIVFGNNECVPAGEECDWTRNFRGKSMFVMPQGGLQNWVIIFPNRVGNDVETFVNTLMQAGRGMRFQIAQPEYVQINDDRTASYVQMMDEVISQLSPTLIFVVLMKQAADKYSAVKKKSLVDRAVPTQVLVAKNLNKKGVMSICTKVAIQMNCKIGGAPWSVQMPMNGLMVIGFDVCHDSKSKGKSYGAMVASLNKPMSRYYSAVSHHATGEELSNDLALNIIKALNCYKKHNGQFPSHIIIYRDGVGDGQIPYVYEHEVARIVGGISQAFGTAPKLAFVIVSKKINTRIFFNKGNPKPGTVVDDVITLPERYDFFIVSQFVTQGTVSPTSYNVIHDTLGLDPDKIQRLTYKMTHCYYNWSGTVRVPAPVQYAHKLAFLVSQSLHRPPNSGLDELLYFL